MNNFYARLLLIYLKEVKFMTFFEAVIIENQVEVIFVNVLKGMKIKRTS